MKYPMIAAALLTSLLTACANRPYQAYPQPYPAVFPYPVQQPVVRQPVAQPQAQRPAANAKDEYGCQLATGATWSVLHQQCVQLFNVANIRMVDPDNSTLAAYAIFSKDRKQAEIFSASLPKGIILSATKGGFISKDGKIRLVDLGKNNWKLAK
ncbi:MAG: hypothetical protein Q4E77_05260 [Conchiformibius sp.]|nr:hypothetical protein [Conchiformibius sp.]